MTSTTNNSSDAEATTPTGSTPTITSESSSIDLAPLNTLYSVLSLDSQWDQNSESWSYADAADSNQHIPDEQVQSKGVEATPSYSDSWKEYCFVVVRKRSKSRDGLTNFNVEIFLMSPYIIKACRDVITDVHGVSWNSQPIKLDPNVLIAYFPRLEEYERNLAARRDRTEKEDHVLKSIGTLLAHTRKHYKQTLARVASLHKNCEITYDLLYTILLPGTIIIQRCPSTGEPRALKFLASREVRNDHDGRTYLDLDCEHLEFITSKDEDRRWDAVQFGDKMGQPSRFGMVNLGVQITRFDGVEKITSLNVYPIDFHPDPSALKGALLVRADKWLSLCSVRHMYYKGDASAAATQRRGTTSGRYSVRSRIMVDKANFLRTKDILEDCDLPASERMLSPRENLATGAHGLAESELLLAPPFVYGFSLSDKLWLEFNVNHVVDIIWNNEAFDGLVLQPERKALLHGLIKVHGGLDAEGPMRFDDFVRGKGRGLVINLFGPPGVGKTLSAEATSEYLQRPLYVMGSGDLGTCAEEVDWALRKAFVLAAAWRAVLLIDKADVFLEQRSPHDIQRNAMVAVFLRHLEYYQGILFLTTNRIRIFDEAFMSRIHIALRFNELSVQTKIEIWRAFLRKAGLENTKLEEKGFLSRLAARNINGRQIKNACKTARSLAASRGEKMQYGHLEQVLNIMEEFMKEFTREQITDQPLGIGGHIVRISTYFVPFMAVLSFIGIFAYFLDCFVTDGSLPIANVFTSYSLRALDT